MNTLALNSKDSSKDDSKDIFKDRPVTRVSTLGAYLSETRYELMRAIRNPSVAIPVLLLPVALYALFAVVIAGEAITKDPDVGIFLFAAFSIMAVTMPALFGAGVMLAIERDMAKIVSGMALAILAYAPIVILAFTTGKLALTGGQVAALSGALLVGTIPFCAMGLMVGSLASGSAAPGFANLIYLPGCYLSGMFFPLPQSMHWQAPIWPQFHVEQFAMHLAGIAKYQYEPLPVAIATMVGYTVLFAAVTIWRLSRKD
jgi:ABC-2 type transport system permease protein